MAHQNVDDFLTHYHILCSQRKVSSSKIIPKLIKGTELSCPVEAVMSWHWPTFLRTLCTDNSLTKVEFSCNLSPTSQKQTSQKLQKIMDKYYPLPYGCSAVNISNICQAVATMLVHSDKITDVRLENLRLTKDDILILADSLSCSKIKALSFAESLIDDESLELLCRKLYHSKISWLNFSSCQISGDRLKSICRLMKYNKNNRTRNMYFLGLRNETPVLDQMMGINRVTLNNNEISDEGVELIMESLEDDLWIKVLDLQKCEIGNEGAKCLLKSLKYNVTFQDIDLRQNDIDTSYLVKITMQLSLNNAGKELKFRLGPLWKPRQYTIRNPRRILRSKKVLKTCPSKPKILPKKPNSSIENAFKFSHAMLNAKSISIEDASVQTEVISVLDEELKKIQKTLSNEIKLRECLMHLLKKYKVENCMLRKEIQKLSKLDDHILIDQETFLEVKSTFEKFKRFLSVMKEYGLFECIAMLGVNENTDIVLKPLILNATKKCMQLVENEPSPTPSTSEAAESLLSINESPKLPQEESSPWCPPETTDIQSALSQNGTTTCFSAEKKMFSIAKSPADKALVQRVYREVRENYGGRPSFPPKHAARRPEMPVRKRAKSSIKPKDVGKMETMNKIRQLRSPKEFYYGKDSEQCNACEGLQDLVHKKTASSQTPPSESQSSEKTLTSGSPQSLLKLASSASMSALGLPPSERPKLKGTTKRNKSVPSSSLSETSGTSISASLLASVHASLKASLAEGEKQHSSSVKSEKTASTLTSVSVTSQGSSSGGKEDSVESYLESVSDAASTDKDVKSLAESEVFSAQSSSKSVRSVNLLGDRTVVENRSEGTNSKSSKKRRAKKLFSQPIADTVTKNASDSSVPSLSDITTVSSRSLNTNSVLGQISNDEA